MSTRREDIMAAMKAKLQAITTAAGYAISVAKAERGLKHPDQVPGTDMPAAFIAGADEARKNNTRTNFESKMRLTVVGMVENSNSQEALQQDLNALIGAITKCVNADPGFGGLASNSEIVSVGTDDSVFSPKAVCEMGIEVQYVRPAIEP